MEGGTVPSAGLRIAPEPQDAKNGLGAGRERGGTCDAPDSAFIAFLDLTRGGDHAVAGFQKPIKPSHVAEVTLEGIGYFEQISRVVDGVFEHLLREGTNGPVGLLGGFGQLDAKVFLHKRGETECGFSHEASGDHGVEKIHRLKIPGSAEQTQIVIGAVKNKTPRTDQIVERLQINL